MKLIHRARRLFLAAVVAGVVAPAASSASPSVAATVTPQEVRESQWYLDAFGITKAHSLTKGEGVTICVVDTGIVPTHPALAGAHVVAGADFSGQGSPDGFTPVGISNRGHGTAMAALIGAQGADGGMLGSAPGATIQAVSAGTGAQTAQAFKWCADHGASVVSASIGSAVNASAIAYLQARDIVIVAAAGNNHSTTSLGPPADQFGVLSVGGVGSDLLHDPMSNYAPYTELMPGEANPGADTQGVAIAGPSSLTSGADAAQCVGFYSASLELEPYSRTCGTSNATAVVAGVVALVRARHPDLNAANVINRILKTATPPADGSAVPSLPYGFGILNAERAVAADVPLVAANPLGSSYTGSYGSWNPAVKPTKAEPPAGATLPPGDVNAPVTGEPWDTALPGGSSAAGGAGIPAWAYAAGGGAVAILLVIGAGLALRRRGKKAAA